MTRGGNNMSMLRQALRVERGSSKHAGGADWQNKSGNSIRTGGEKMSDSSTTSSCWVPHPRSGIYFPKGHEWVMDGLPEHAASLKQTFWLRDVDGVDKAEEDSPPNHGFHASV